MALGTGRGLLMLPLGYMAGYAQVAIIKHNGVIDPLCNMAPGRTTAAQVHVHVVRMSRDGWLRVTRLAVDPGLVMIRVAAFAVRLRTKCSPASMTRCTPHASVNVVIENQRARTEFGRRQPESYDGTHRFGSDLPRRMAALALRVPHIYMVAVRTPLPIGDGRRRSRAVALRALIGRVKLMLKARQVRTRLAKYVW